MLTISPSLNHFGSKFLDEVTYAAIFTVPTTSNLKPAVHFLINANILMYL